MMIGRGFVVSCLYEMNYWGNLFLIQSLRSCFVLRFRMKKNIHNREVTLTSNTEDSTIKCLGFASVASNR